MILDYLRRTKEGIIVIPPFHTGHLGFVPDTEVFVGLAAPWDATASHCELLVTPFPPNMGSMFRLRCTMVDQPGIVNRLVDAVSALNINIVGMESAGINYLNNHVVEMVLDWSTSDDYRERDPTPAPTRAHYSSLQHRIPISELRNIRLFESIVARCGDKIALHHEHDGKLPAISIRPLGGSAAATPERVTIRRMSEPDGEGKAGRKANGAARDRPEARFNVRFKVPKGIFERVRSLTGYEEDDSIRYILSSEADSRSLRVFIPQKTTVSQIVHVAFVHADAPGALSAITKVLAAQEFNILTGLLRKKTERRSGYETVLQYLGNDKVPDARDRSPTIVRWVKDKLEECEDPALNELPHFTVEIGPPEYPLTRSPEFHTVGSGPGRPSEIDKGSPSDRLEKLIEEYKEREQPRGDEYSERLDYLESQLKLMTRHPGVFLSYPKVAERHAERIKLALEARFGPKRLSITDGMAPGFEYIVDQVMDDIRACDFFIGIWHHEEELGHDVGTVSPWLPFEYGIALEAGKKCVIIHSDRLPPTISRRISPGISQPAYNDLTFLERTVEDVVEYCATHWLPEFVRNGQAGDRGAL